MIVAAGTKESGEKWQKDYGLSFPLIVDPDWKLYRLLGQRRSTDVWSFANIVSFAEKKLAGIPLAATYDGDDFHIMGGDFVVEDAGKLLYAHPSKTTTDRPTMEEFFSVLDSLS